MLNMAREFFWPILENSSAIETARSREEQNSQLEKIETLDSSREVDAVLRAAQEIYAEENDRAKTADNKAFQYLLVVAAIVSLLTYLESSIWESKLGMAPRWLSLLILLLAVLYLVWAAGWALRAVSVRAYYVVGVQDVTTLWMSRAPKVSLAKEYLKATLKNYESVNSKVSAVKMATEFLLRAIVSFGFLLVVQVSWEIVRLGMPYAQPIWNRLTIWLIEYFMSR